MKLKKEIINENIRLITERLSISDEVNRVANMLYEDVEKYFQRFPSSMVKSGLFKREKDKVYNIWGYDVNVHYIIYDFVSQKVFNKDLTTLEYKNSFDADTMTLTLTLAALFGSLYIEYCEDRVYHEVEHLYQWCMNKTNNKNFIRLTDDAYDYNIKRLNDPKDAIEKRIAWIMYYSNPREQDAYAHEYYVQARQSMAKFLDRDTEVENRYRQYCNWIEWLEEHMNDPEVLQYLQNYSDYGYSPHNILTYAKKGRKRFSKKLEHVRRLINSLTNTRIPYDPNDDIVESIARKVIQRIRQR